MERKKQKENMFQTKLRSLQSIQQKKTRRCEESRKKKSQPISA